MELSVGRYPLPALTALDYQTIFGIEPDDVVLGNGQVPPPSAPATSPKSMAIFELLNYIVNEVGFLNTASLYFYIEAIHSTLGLFF